ncbi:unnamed protein product [Linum tenue]|uniref:RanBP2-type domain-containing protein n=1 Tax=Linum tenue TaxID=586396 RepID=A0AAV0QDY1_9ROSI|nr:unnamed protein product [Linum tenue]
MGSREKEHGASHHQPLLSSLVVRPSSSDGGGEGGGSGSGGGDVGGGGGRGGGFETGEARREMPPYSRSERFSDAPGYRMNAGSGSPARRRDGDHRYASDFDHSGGPPRGREFMVGRDAGRFRDSSPPFSRGRSSGGGRPLAREFDRPGLGPGPFRGEAINRNNPNVRPRDGDWVCSDPMCTNLNFARRDVCNNCKKPRYAQPWGSRSPPRRGYPGPPPPHAVGGPRRPHGPPLDLSPPGRAMNIYRSPPPPRGGWGRGSPRDFGPGGPPHLRHGGRFSDPRERPDYPDDDYRGRSKFDHRPMPPVEWGHRERGRDGFFNERRGGFDRRMPLSPPPPAAAPLPIPPQRGGRWGRDVRERSRSPMRGGPPPSRDFRRDMFMGRGGRDDRRPLGRDRVGDVY